MEKFTSEILPSGVKIELDKGNGTFYISDLAVCIQLTKDDIARMSGIAYPEKVHGKWSGCCSGDIAKSQI